MTWLTPWIVQNLGCHCDKSWFLSRSYELIDIIQCTILPHWITMTWCVFKELKELALSKHYICMEIWREWFQENMVLKKHIGVVSQSFIRVSIVSKNIFIMNTIFLLIHPAIKTLPAPTRHSGFTHFAVNFYFCFFKPAQFKLTSFSKSNSKDGTQMGSSSGSWYLDRKGCFKARSTVMRSAGFITSILPIKSSAFLLALGKSVVHGMGWRWPRPVPHRQWHVCTAVTLTYLGHFESDLDLFHTMTRVHCSDLDIIRTFWEWPRPAPHRQWHVCTAVTLTSLGHFESDLELFHTDNDMCGLQWPWHH